MVFGFDEGECVNHRCGALASIVVARGLTASGREHYRIERTAKSDVPRRTIMGDALVSMRPGSEGCDGCMLTFCPQK
jgi:hypothetical protein